MHTKNKHVRYIVSECFTLVYNELRNNGIWDDLVVLGVIVLQTWQLMSSSWSCVALFFFNPFPPCFSLLHASFWQHSLSVTGSGMREGEDQGHRSDLNPGPLRWGRTLPLELLGRPSHLVSISWVLTLSSHITAWCTWCVLLLLFYQPTVPAQLRSDWHIASCLFSPDKNQTKFTTTKKKACWNNELECHINCNLSSLTPAYANSCYAPLSLSVFTDFLSTSSPHSAQ